MKKYSILASISPALIVSVSVGPVFTKEGKVSLLY